MKSENEFRHLRRVLILPVLVLLPCITMAQRGLHINEVFGHYHDKKNAVEVLVSGHQLDDYGISHFHSITVTGSAAELFTIEDAVLQDAVSAVEKETGKVGGHLYYGFYRLKGTFSSDAHRYIVFRNSSLKKGGKSDVTLIYLEGTASMKSLKQRFK